MDDTGISDQENRTELTFEPNIHPAAKEFQEKIYSDGTTAICLE